MENESKQNPSSIKIERKKKRISWLFSISFTFGFLPLLISLLQLQRAEGIEFSMWYCIVLVSISLICLSIAGFFSTKK